MKYLKKIFEDFDSKSQYEIIEDFFLDLIFMLWLMKVRCMMQ